MLNRIDEGLNCADEGRFLGAIKLKQAFCGLQMQAYRQYKVNPAKLLIIRLFTVKGSANYNLSHYYTIKVELFPQTNN